MCFCMFLQEAYTYKHMKRYVPIIIGVVALCAVLYLGSSKISSDEKNLANDEMKVSVTSKSFQGTFTKLGNTLEYGFDLPETATATVSMDGALIKVADMNSPVLAMYLSYEGDRGYLPADYITNKIMPKVPGITQMGQKMVGEYEWTVVESANSEWHVASIENGKWLLIVENTKAVNEQAMSILETALASVPYMMSETSPVDAALEMETATETTVFEK